MFKRKATVEIGPYKVTIDAEDQSRVIDRKWTPIEGEFVMFITDVGPNQLNPVFRTLGQLILGTERFVEIKDRSFVGQLDYRKSNLKAH